MKASKHMKRIPQPRRLLPFLALAASLQITLGYYDPGIQRWINRDPIVEPGFTLRAQPGIAHEKSVSLYAFNANNPITQIDATGLAAGIPGKVFFFPCPQGFNAYCFGACAIQGMRASPFCYFYRSAGHTFFVFDCGCCNWRR